MFCPGVPFSHWVGELDGGLRDAHAYGLHERRLPFGPGGEDGLEDASDREVEAARLARGGRR